MHPQSKTAYFKALYLFSGTLVSKATSTPMQNNQKNPKPAFKMGAQRAGLANLDISNISISADGDRNKLFLPQSNFTRFYPYSKVTFRHQK